MADAWGGSWGTSWGVSWSGTGATAPPHKQVVGGIPSHGRQSTSDHYRRVSQWWDQYDDQVTRTAKLKRDEHRKAAELLAEQVSRTIEKSEEIADVEQAQPQFAEMFAAVDRVIRAKKAARLEEQTRRAEEAVRMVEAKLAAIEEENIAILLLMA